MQPKHSRRPSLTEPNRLAQLEALLSAVQKNRTNPCWLTGHAIWTAVEALETTPPEPEPVIQMKANHSSRAGWLRAAVLGSDDAIVSTGSLMIGVAASSASKHAVLIAGVAGLMAGAMSMAAGEFVSVSSQRDAQGDGIIGEPTARPLQAAVVSFFSFVTFALIPIAAELVAPPVAVIPFIAITSLLSLALLGGAAGYLSGSSVIRGALRVAIGGSLAMLVTAGVGRLLGVATG
jgi:VIT1/CCC1 family predicted Fe2+/Mn2+ transporter